LITMANLPKLSKNLYVSDGPCAISKWRDSFLPHDSRLDVEIVSVYSYGNELTVSLAWLCNILGRSCCTQRLCCKHLWGHWPYWVSLLQLLLHYNTSALSLGTFEWCEVSGYW
jgi:hypothetical protein